MNTLAETHVSSAERTVLLVTQVPTSAKPVPLTRLLTASNSASAMTAITKT